MAKHMAAKKSNLVRNASVAAVASAALVGSIAPANAFAVATPTTSVSNYAPALTSYSYEAESTYSFEAASTVSTQSETVAEWVDSNVSDKRQAIVDAAYDGIGGAYVWGGKSYKAWDCSGFVSYVYAQAGIGLTAYTYAMAGELTPTSTPQPGDVVFTNGYSHVGIYVGNGQMISALNPAQGTQLTSVDGGGFMPVDGYYTYAGL